jgi:TolA-binding protein
MKTAKRLILSLSALLLISGVALTVPVSARDGTSGHADAETSTTGTETQTEIESHASTLKEQFRDMAQTDLAQKKTQIKEHTQQERQTACEARKTNLTKRMANAVRQAQNHKAVFDKIYTRVKDFHDSKNLSVANYDTLVANVDKAQADAAASISALQSLDVSVDCH